VTVRGYIALTFHQPHSQFSLATPAWEGVMSTNNYCYVE